jgi:uncharacterized repeat protein (TIGR03943 family)
MSFLKDKVAIITGGGKAAPLQDGSAGSIGYGIAIAYAKEGANLVLTGRNMQKLLDAKEEIERLYGVRVLAVQADINENEDDYDGKTFVIKGRVALSDELPAGQFAFGRHVMTCCEADIQFAGLLAYYSGAEELKVGDWVEITAKVRVEYTEAYKEKGPVLYIKKLEKTEACEPEVATF